MASAPAALVEEAKDVVKDGRETDTDSESLQAVQAEEIHSEADSTSSDTWSYSPSCYDSTTASSDSSLANIQELEPSTPAESTVQRAKRKEKAKKPRKKAHRVRAATPALTALENEMITSEHLFAKCMEVFCDVYLDKLVRKERRNSAISTCPNIPHLTVEGQPLDTSLRYDPFASAPASARAPRKSGASNPFQNTQLEKWLAAASLVRKVSETFLAEMLAWQKTELDHHGAPPGQPAPHDDEDCENCAAHDALAVLAAAVASLAAAGSAAARKKPPDAYLLPLKAHAAPGEGPRTPRRGNGALAPAPSGGAKNAKLGASPRAPAVRTPRGSPSGSAAASPPGGGRGKAASPASSPRGSAAVKTPRAAQSPGGGGAPVKRTVSDSGAARGSAATHRNTPPNKPADAVPPSPRGSAKHADNRTRALTATSTSSATLSSAGSNYTTTRRKSDASKPVSQSPTHPGKSPRQRSGADAQQLKRTVSSPSVGSSAKNGVLRGNTASSLASAGRRKSSGNAVGQFADRRKSNGSLTAAGGGRRGEAKRPATPEGKVAERPAVEEQNAATQCSINQPGLGEGEGEDDEDSERELLGRSSSTSSSSRNSKSDSEGREDDAQNRLQGAGDPAARLGFDLKKQALRADNPVPTSDGTSESAQPNGRDPLPLHQLVTRASPTTTNVTNEASLPDELTDSEPGSPWTASILSQRRVISPLHSSPLAIRPPTSNQSPRFNVLPGTPSNQSRTPVSNRSQQNDLSQPQSFPSALPVPTGAAKTVLPQVSDSVVPTQASTPTRPQSNEQANNATQTPLGPAVLLTAANANGGDFPGEVSALEEHDSDPMKVDRSTSTSHALVNLVGKYCVTSQQASKSGAFLVARLPDELSDSDLGSPLASPVEKSAVRPSIPSPITRTPPTNTDGDVAQNPNSASARSVARHASGFLVRNESMAVGAGMPLRKTASCMLCQSHRKDSGDLLRLGGFAVSRVAANQGHRSENNAEGDEAAEAQALPLTQTHSKVTDANGMAVVAPDVASVLAPGETLVGILEKNFRRMIAYADYVTMLNFSQNDSTLFPAAAAFQEAAEKQLPKDVDSSFDGLAILPVQRLSKYLCFADKFIQVCDPQDLLLFLRLREQVSMVVNYCNTRARNSDSIRRVGHLSEKLQVPALLQPCRTVLLESTKAWKVRGDIRKRKRLGPDDFAAVHVYLLSDTFICWKQKRGILSRKHIQVPLSSVRISSIRDTSFLSQIWSPPTVPPPSTVEPVSSPTLPPRDLDVSSTFRVVTDSEDLVFRAASPTDAELWAHAITAQVRLLLDSAPAAKNPDNKRQRRRSSSYHEPTSPRPSGLPACLR
ncbi:hypothetical protein DIPPA_31921 [Diplonema papillatum]|nr:hypothetical protein DIPPA_31921 [Diplonema papillatum]